MSAPEVHLLLQHGPYRLEQLNELSTSTPVARPTIPKSPKSSITAAALSLYGEPDADPERIADQCPLIGALRIDPGQFSEPTIYAVVGVLQHCEHSAERDQGRHWFDAEYADDVERKFAHHERSNVGPTTCDFFATLHPEICKVCPHWQKITSPIQLGHKGSISRSDETPPTETKAPEESRLQPLGFKNFDNGLHALSEDKKKEPIYIQVTDVPVEFVSYTKSEARNTGGVVLSHRLPSNEVNETAISGDIIYGNRCKEVCGLNHIAIIELDLFRTWITASKAIYLKGQKMELLYDRFGWKDDNTAFLWGNRLYKNGDVVIHRVSGELQHHADLLRPTPHGSLKAWSNAANQLFGQGMEAQAFGLVASFGTPLMRLLSPEEGGAILSLVNRSTGTGKTTLLEGCASVWGQYKGMKIFDNDTQLAKPMKLGFLGNLPACYDELATRDPEIIRQFVLAFTNGQDRARVTRTGTGLVASASEWQTVLFLVSNKPITEILTAPDQPAAMAFRLLELTVSITDRADSTRGDELRKIMATNAGWAADAYLRYITRPEVLDQIKKSLEHYSQQITDKAKLTKDHRFWRRLVACAAVAAVITKHLGILDFSPQHLINWVCAQMTEQKVNLHKTTRWTAAEKLVEFLNQHNMHELIVQHEYKPRIATVGAIQEPRMELMIRRELNTNTCYVTMSLLHSYLNKQNIHRNEFLAELKQVGVLREENKSITLGANTILAKGQQRCYEFDLGHPAVTGFPRMAVIAGGKEARAL